MFKIKICGITTPEDALVAAEAGEDAIGLNFYEKSPRYVSPEMAKAIVAMLPASVIAAGVFVNAALDKVVEQQRFVGLDVIQLHGSEPPSMLYKLSSSPFNRVNRFTNERFSCTEVQFIKAIRSSDSSLEGARQFLLQCMDENRAIKADPLPDALLLDAFDSAQHGGTGRSLDWQKIADARDRIWCRFILAGGLTPDNVAEAIRLARPDAVDVASGVESSPGKKDQAKVREFVAVAKEAFATLTGNTGDGFPSPG